MKKLAFMCLVAVAALAGCPADEPADGNGGADNPVTAGQIAYCKPLCLKYQECNRAVFDLKWGTLDACELECNPLTEASACLAECDVDHPTDAVQHEACVVYCEREVSPAACKATCDKISDTYAHDSCVAGCNRGFSQACADVMGTIHTCYLGLECERAVEYRDFGGSASGLGECINDDAVGTSC